MPAYNEVSRLPIMLQEALLYLEERHSNEYEVLVVDDGSTDDTAQVALKVAKDLKGKGGQHIKVIKLQFNRGKGGAVTHVCFHYSVVSFVVIDMLPLIIRACSSRVGNKFYLQTPMQPQDLQI